MSMIELETDNLQEIVTNNSLTIVQYGAGWCGNCRMIKPKFKHLASENENIAFVYADAEKFPGTRQLAEVNNLPTFAAFKDGKLIKQAQGNKIELVQDLLNEITGN